ncbi:rluA, partial [Symbiodinium pilosum]
MHQIRAHFAHRGFPLAGDVRYAPKKEATAWCGQRLFLHAAHLWLSDGFQATSPLKEDLIEPLRELGLAAESLAELRDPGFFQRCRPSEPKISRAKESDSSDTGSEDTDVEALLAKGGASDWDPSTAAPSMTPPPNLPKPEIPPAVEAEERRAAELRGADMA